LARMFGYRLSELVGMNLIDLFAPQSQQLGSLVIKSHDKKPYEIICLKKSGSAFNAEISAKLFSYKGEKISLIFIHDITNRKKIEDKIKHLNAVLRAIRQVNQLIVKERNREKLIQDACHNLIENFGYGSAWIAVFDQGEKFITSAEAGFGRHFRPMIKLFQQGQLPVCVKKALSQSGILVIRHPELSCPECPLHDRYNGRGPMVIRLQYKRKIYGLLSVSMPVEFLSEKEEKSLFKEVAGDISFALYSLELEEKRKQAEREIRSYREKLRLLALKLSRAEEIGRRKMAAFLHDQIGQKLALAKIELGALSESTADVKVVKEQVKKLRKLIKEIIQDTRQLTFELAPPMLYELGFEKSLKWLVDEYRKQYKLQCDFTDDGRPKPLAEDLSPVLFQAVRELLMNVVKHAQAEKVKVTVSRVKNRIKVSIEDDGLGFDPSVAKPYSPQTGGFGLFHIRERLREFEGGLDIKSGKGRGTKVVLLAPLAVKKRAADSK